MERAWRHVVLFLPIQEVSGRKMVLLARREHGKAAGKLVPPGGELEASDTSLYGAVVRECLEELEIAPSFPSVFAGGVAIEPDQLALFVFIGPYTGQAKATSELTLPWLYPIEQLPRDLRVDARYWMSPFLEHYRCDRKQSPRFRRILHNDRGEVRRLDNAWPHIRLPLPVW